MNPVASFEDIYNHIANISKEFGINYTYLNTIRMVLDEGKLKKVDGSIVKFAKSYNKTLDELYLACEKSSKQMNDKNKVHLFVVKQYIDIIKKNIG